MALAYSVVAAPGNLSHFSITPQPARGNGVIVGYRGLQGNLPQKYGNTIALWQSLFPNPNDTPIIVVKIPNDNSPGAVFVPNSFVETDYCLTYQVGADFGTMCALAQLPLAQSGNLIPTFVDMQIDKIETDSIRVFYSTLPGYMPRTYKNWVGVWQGFAIPYNAPPPVGSLQIANDWTQDYVTISGLSLNASFEYTLIYFTGPARTNAASLLYFRTGQTA